MHKRKFQIFIFEFRTIRRLTSLSMKISTAIVKEFQTTWIILTLSIKSSPYLPSKIACLFYFFLFFISNRMNKLSKQLLLDLDGVSSTLFQMGETFANLYNLSNHFNNHSNVGRNIMLDDVYVTLNNMCFDWGKKKKKKKN
jgi:hypothetical protein